MANLDSQHLKEALEILHNLLWPFYDNEGSKCSLCGTEQGETNKDCHVCVAFNKEHALGHRVRPWEGDSRSLRALRELYDALNDDGYHMMIGNSTEVHELVDHHVVHILAAKYNEQTNS